MLIFQKKYILSCGNTDFTERLIQSDYWSFSSHTGNCSNLLVTGINVTVPNTSTPGSVIKNVGCMSGFQLKAESSVKNVLCQPNGSWTSFPDCEGNVLLCTFPGSTRQVENIVCYSKSVISKLNIGVLQNFLET